MGLKVISYAWVCSFCGDRVDVHHDADSMSVDQVKSHVTIVPKGWRRIDGKAWCCACDPRSEKQPGN